MIALALAAALAQQPAPAMNTGNWVVVAVQRVIAPDQTQGQCFLQGKVETVIHGRAFQQGDAIALSMSCRASGFTPTAYAPAPPVPTIQALRSQKRVLVHVDAAGRVLENGYWGFEAIIPAGPK